MTRIDKADILELTVSHLRKHQRSDTQTFGKMTYEKGFQDCARQATNFLATNGLVDASRLIELNCYLESIGGRSRTNRSPHGNQYTSTPNRFHADFKSIHGTPNVSNIQMLDLSPIQQRSFYGTNHSAPGCILQGHRFESTSTFDTTQNLLNQEGCSNLPRADSQMTTGDGLNSLSSFEDSSSSFSSSQSTSDFALDGYGGLTTSRIFTGSGDKPNKTWRPW